MWTTDTLTEFYAEQDRIGCSPGDSWPPPALREMVEPQLARLRRVATGVGLAGFQALVNREQAQPH